ncbi:hypothetical protein [Flavobacterium rhizosphaerae]|uniref:Outer membrane protein beta-barrel domain-containing protein n=1 Tax=Flavobacterium rhizosphaerae TaxID=3163298 RepID=A0ABW8YT46_9FLAO
MKKLFFMLCLSASTFSTMLFAQQTPINFIEQSVYNVQTGFLGVYVSNETRLGNKFALRTEIGLDAGFSINTEGSEWGLIPMINLEPRYYYNIGKRAGKGRNISGNAANFVTISTRFNPDFMVFSTNDSETASTLFFIPKWGIRRNIGKSNFNYEAGIGIGYYVMLGDNKKYFYDQEGVGVDLHLRIGYTF